MKNILKSLLVALSLCLCGQAIAAAQDAQSSDSKTAEAEAMLKAHEKDYTYGPATVPLLDQGSMKLQAGQAFIPPGIALKLLTTAGANIKDTEGFAGLVVPGLPGDETPSDDWGAVAVFFKPTGFVRDDDAKTWDTGKILDGIRKSVESRNKEARKNGAPESIVNGWIEAPKYDESQHRLIWAISSQEKEVPDSAVATFSSAALGREGIMFFTFITQQDKLEARRLIAIDMLNGIEFGEGKRYADFAEGTDRVAEIGLAALVGGVMAKKLGLFATLALLLAKWGKVAAMAIGGMAVFKWRKKKATASEQ